MMPVAGRPFINYVVESLVDSGAGEIDFRTQINPRSLQVVEGARVEAALAAVKPAERYQFERKGYYFADPKDSREGAPVFNLIVPLRDTWGKSAAG